MCSPPIVVRQLLGIHVPAATNTLNNRRIVGGVVFCTILIILKENLLVCLCIPLSLLGNGSLNTFPRRRRIDGGAVFYAVHVVSKESRRLVLIKTSRYFLVYMRKCSDEKISVGILTHLHVYSTSKYE
jgi:hypothetical protein